MRRAGHENRRHRGDPSGGSAPGRAENVAALPAQIRRRPDAAAEGPAGEGGAARDDPGRSSVACFAPPACDRLGLPGQTGHADPAEPRLSRAGRHPAGCYPPGGHPVPRVPAAGRTDRVRTPVRPDDRARHAPGHPAGVVLLATGSAQEWTVDRRGPGGDGGGVRPRDPKNQLGQGRIDCRRQAAALKDLVDSNRWALRCPLSAAPCAAGECVGVHAPERVSGTCRSARERGAGPWTVAIARRCRSGPGERAALSELGS